MDRIGVLIQKLNEQYRGRVPLSQVLTTVMMLQKEITGSIRETEVLGSALVSVLIPNAVSASKRPAVAAISDEKEYFELRLTEDDMLSTDEPDDGFYEEALAKYKINTIKPRYNGTVNEKIPLQPESSKSGYMSMDEIPTLARQVRDEGVPLFKHEAAMPAKIKDLKRDIPAEERQQFINELFRGDENMYERSVKTIDNFSIFAEAEYWIKRELKTKLGWLHTNPAVTRFDELVKRRFG